MPRLERGENSKIDHINDLVLSVKLGMTNHKECMGELIELFTPLLLRICYKWSQYFQDQEHNVISFDELMNDARYWMVVYTKDKYAIDGEATYNNFIRSHIDSRIRYIYEAELSRRKKLIFPDPDRNPDREDTCKDMFDEVIMKYSSNIGSDSILDDIIDNEHIKWTKDMCNAIYTICDSKLSDREREIFERCIVNNESHNDVADDLKVSRSRVSQIVCKIRKIIISNIEDDYWRIKDYE